MRDTERGRRQGERYERVEKERWGADRQRGGVRQGGEIQRGGDREIQREREREMGSRETDR